MSPESAITFVRACAERFGVRETARLFALGPATVSYILNGSVRINGQRISEKVAGAKLRIQDLMNKERNMQGSEITPGQVKRVHALKNALGMTDAQYREALRAYHVYSSKQLNAEQAHWFITELERAAVARGKWTRPGQKYQHLAGRRMMATPRQLRMIEAMWADVSRATNAELRAQGLLAFLARFGVSGIEDVTQFDVKRVVAALEAMKASREDRPQ